MAEETAAKWPKCGRLGHGCHGLGLTSPTPLFATSVTGPPRPTEIGKCTEAANAPILSSALCSRLSRGGRRLSVCVVVLTQKGCHLIGFAFPRFVVLRIVVGPAVLRRFAADQLQSRLCDVGSRSGNAPSDDQNGTVLALGHSPARGIWMWPVRQPIHPNPELTKRFKERGSPRPAQCIDDAAPVNSGTELAQNDNRASDQVFGLNDTAHSSPKRKHFSCQLHYPTVGFERTSFGFKPATRGFSQGLSSCTRWRVWLHGTRRSWRCDSVDPSGVAAARRPQGGVRWTSHHVLGAREAARPCAFGNWAAGVSGEEKRTLRPAAVYSLSARWRAQRLQE